MHRLTIYSFKEKLCSQTSTTGSNVKSVQSTHLTVDSCLIEISPSHEKSSNIAPCTCTTRQYAYSLSKAIVCLHQMEIASATKLLCALVSLIDAKYTCSITMDLNSRNNTKQNVQFSFWTKLKT